MFLDTVLTGDPGPGEGVCLEVSPLLQHEGSLSPELQLTRLAGGEDADPVVLVSVVLSPIIVVGLDQTRGVKEVLEAACGSLD